jgi:hypothetical protein
MGINGTLIAYFPSYGLTAVLIVTPLHNVAERLLYCLSMPSHGETAILLPIRIVGDAPFENGIKR